MIIKDKLGSDPYVQIKYLEYYTCVVQEPFELNLQVFVNGIPENFLHPTSTRVLDRFSAQYLKLPMD